MRWVAALATTAFLAASAVGPVEAGPPACTVGADQVAQVLVRKRPPPPRPSLVLPRQLIDQRQWLSITPDGRFMATARVDGTVRVWDLQSGRPTTLQRPGHAIGSLALSSDGSRVALGGSHATIYTDVKSPPQALLVTPSPTPSAIWMVAWAPGSTDTAVAAPDGTIHTGHGRRFMAHPGGIAALCYSADGQRLVSAGRDGTVAIWSTVSHTLERRLTLGQPAISLAVSPNGLQVAAGGTSRTMVWLRESGQVQRQMELPGPPTALAFDGRGRLAVGWSTLQSSGLVGTLRIVSPQDGRCWGQWPTPGAPTAVAFLPDGRRLAVATSNGQLRLHSAPTGKLLLALHDGPSGWVASTPQGSLHAASETVPLLRWQVGPQSVPFETYKARYWQPQLIARTFR